MPKISVIVPVYKVEPYLQRCVDSILNQSFSDLELILVDDGSPDRCGEMCDAFAREDSRVHVIHQENGGLSAARNAGIDWFFTNSDSQWMTFVDSDDWIHRDYLQTMLFAAEKHGVTQVMCDFLSTDHDLEDLLLPEKEEAVLSAEEAFVHYYGFCMHAWGKILHRSLMMDFHFPLGKLHEDSFVTHKLTFSSEKIAICDVPLYYYYSNPESITRVKWSERRLHEFEAHEIRLKYLQSQGYERAFLTELEAYTFNLFAQLQDLTLLSKQDPGYHSHRKQLRKRALPVFHKARKQGLFPYQEQNIWIYELAYPIKPIWVMRNLICRALGK